MTDLSIQRVLVVSLMKIVAIAVVWTALVIIVQGELIFTIVDAYDVIVAIGVLVAGTLMTLGILWGLDIVRFFGRTVEPSAGIDPGRSKKE
ncbi:hypothetical protein JXA80_12140 [bacterium]|nr:hypothetical protein [candidate division CSSED10-310 bacterium]